MNQDKNSIFKEFRRFEKQQTEEFKKWMVDQAENLRVEGFKIQNSILDNIKAFENELAQYKVALNANEKKIEDMQAQIDLEYREFSQ